MYTEDLERKDAPLIEGQRGHIYLPMTVILYGPEHFNQGGYHFLHLNYTFYDSNLFRHLPCYSVACPSVLFYISPHQWSIICQLLIVRVNFV